MWATDRVTAVYYVAVACLLTSCGAPPQSQTKHLAFNPEARNVALIIGLDYENSPRDFGYRELPGIDLDVSKMRAIFASTPFDFETRTLFNPTKTQLLESLSQAAGEVDDNGTLLIYYSGHGTFSLDSSDFDVIGRFRLSHSFVTMPRFSGDNQYKLSLKSLIDRIGQARASKMKRFILLDDSCHSGAFVQSESDALVSVANGVEMLLPPYDSITDQALLFAAARHDQLANASVWGSAFTLSLEESLRELSEVPDSTLGQLVQTATARTINHPENRRGHTPVYAAYPSSEILSDLLLE